MILPIMRMDNGADSSIASIFRKRESRPRPDYSSRRILRERRPRGTWSVSCLAVSPETKCASFAVAGFSEGEEIRSRCIRKPKDRWVNDAIRGNQTDTGTLGGDETSACTGPPTDPIPAFRRPFQRKNRQKRSQTMAKVPPDETRCEMESKGRENKRRGCTWSMRKFRATSLDVVEIVSGGHRGLT
ncbi:hypothetical protein K0M31_013068 [Melipona bicolor]|uniref:Uncharacterized protein n=1 Tax=Melipona bicolor TaxID=60889 RepID=A0AA40KGS4_9HYME|nr:hypothetical protein K0M31_013068 [Melipona bicolor]